MIGSPELWVATSRFSIIFLRQIDAVLNYGWEAIGDASVEPTLVAFRITWCELGSHRVGQNRKPSCWGSCWTCHTALPPTRWLTIVWYSPLTAHQLATCLAQRERLWKENILSLSEEESDPVGVKMHPLVNYVLSLAGKNRPKVCCIPTATGDSPAGLLRFYSNFPASLSEPSHLELFERTVGDIREYLLSQDVIFVLGGNTANMLAVWRVHGVDLALKEAWEAGVVLCGGSSGSLCWFECGTTDSFNLNDLRPLYDGLGFLPGSHCPHYDGEEQRRPLYHSLISEGFPPGYAIDDDAAIHFIGTEVSEVVSGRVGATAYRVELIGGQVVETPLNAQQIK